VRGGRSPLSAYRVLLRLAVDASSAIQHLHQQRILHRDIAARNFLVNQEQRVFVSDFGMSVQLPPVSAVYEGRLDEPIPIAWCAPELFKSPRVFSTATDVYAFGVFLFELFIQQPPFDSKADLTKEVRKNGSIRPTIPGWCPNRLNRVMTSCWAASHERPNMPAVNKELKEIHTQLSVAYDVTEVFGDVQPLGSSPLPSPSSSPSSSPLRNEEPASLYNVYS